MCGCCGSKDEGDEPPIKPAQSPLKDRCCTDILFLVLFVVFWVGMIYVAAFSIVNGDAYRLVYGYDSFGNTCNEDNRAKAVENVTNSGQNMLGRPSVYFMNYLKPFDSMQICISQCPNEVLLTPQQVKDWSERTGSKLCAYDVPIQDYTDLTLYAKGRCPILPVVPSVSFLNRCVPDVLGVATNTTLATQIVKMFNADDIFRKVLSDMYNSWRELLIFCGVALGIALLMVLLIRFLAFVIVWLIVALAVVGSIAGTAFLWWTYIQTRDKLNDFEKLKIPLLDVDLENEKAFFGMAIAATVLTVILLLIILVMRKRLQLVVALFKEAGNVLSKMPLLLIQPIWTFLILMAFFVYWIVVLAFISTAGKPVPDYKPEFTGIKYEELGPIRYFWWYHLVGLIWTSEFILACQQMTIAGAVAAWFFTRNRKNLPCPIGKSVCRLILHHIGSLAFGAFIITLVKLPRLILMYMERQMKGSENQCAKFMMRCCICCLKCLEKCLKFLNQNAYTIIAIEGTNFCTSAQRAFRIILSNILRVAAINSVGDFVLFLGKIGVMACTSAAAIYVFRDRNDLHFYAVPVILVAFIAFLLGHVFLSVYESNPALNFYAIPVLVITAFSFLIAHCFLSVYEMVIDALLLCFCEDSRLHDGTPGNEYFMPPSLMQFVKNSSDQLERLEKRKKPGAMLSDQTAV